MSESTFWRFSLDLYARPGIADACLRLQDEFGADVNVLLYLLFAASRGRVLDASALALIETTVGAWRASVVLPLRTVRRSLKDRVGPFETALTASLRTEVKRIELAAERLQQEMLEHRLPVAAIGLPAIEPAAAARDNLTAYGRRLGPGALATIDELLRLVDLGATKHGPGATI